MSVKGGHLIDRATLEQNRAVVNDADMQVADDLFIAPLTADEFEGVMMFLNHSCEPNVGVQGQVVFVALRDVAAGEELTIDYGRIDHDAEPMACRCGAASCRGTITSEDWRRPDLQRKYGDHCAWHLLRRMRSERGRFAVAKPPTYNSLGPSSTCGASFSGPISFSNPFIHEFGDSVGFVNRG